MSEKMPYEFRSKCCNNPDPDFSIKVAISGYGFKEVILDLDEETGEIHSEDSYQVEDTQYDDYWDETYECIWCQAEHTTPKAGIEVIRVDEVGEEIPKGRYWCDYCNWTGNFVEDHPNDCKFGVNGPRNV